MQHVFLVAIGGALGAALRHLTNLAMARLFGVAFPWGTLTVNIAGGLLMGLFVEVLARRLGASPELRLFVATGILGGYTTFSAFAMDVAAMIERGAVAVAAGYVTASVDVDRRAVSRNVAREKPRLMLSGPAKGTAARWQA